MQASLNLQMSTHINICWYLFHFCSTLRLIFSSFSTFIGQASVNLAEHVHTLSSAQWESIKTAEYSWMLSMHIITLHAYDLVQHMQLTTFSNNTSLPIASSSLTLAVVESWTDPHAVQLLQTNDVLTLHKLPFTLLHRLWTPFLKIKYDSLSKVPFVFSISTSQIYLSNCRKQYQIKCKHTA